MKSSSLGLPLEYQEIPEYFDAHNIGDDTKSKNGVLEKILQKHDTKTVIDLTCGTGSQVFFLNERGYKVTGSDFSPALLRIARGKVQSADIDFIDGDMRTLKVGEFDAAITMFNAIGHLTKCDFEKTMQNICENLKTGGIYVFDIFNLAAMSNDAVTALAMDTTKPVNGGTIRRIQHSICDKNTGMLRSYDDYIFYKPPNIPRRYKHDFILQIYTAKELRFMLDKNGFDTLEQVGMDGSKFLDGETINILTIARKR